ncbi:MAG: hypothetical protein V7L23_06580, partial [Nostoc sp.]|uniref:hypothetical protein n=1 Tax=Nostoc sp. TaxID=1180 RepID=UPI002FF046EB
RGAGEQGSRGEFNVPCSFPSAPLHFKLVRNAGQSLFDILEREARYRMKFCILFNPSSLAIADSYIKIYIYPVKSKNSYQG